MDCLCFLPLGVEGIMARELRRISVIPMIKIGREIM
jgi:hypothetical protein